MDKILALREMYEAGGRRIIKPKRVKAIINWPVPNNVTDIRAFLSTVESARQYIKNFSEMQRPLRRLTGKVN